MIEYYSYSADIAQQDYDYKASSKGPELKILKDYAVEYVEYKIIEEKYSPDAIIMELENNDFCNPITEVKRVEDWLNNYPRRLLGGLSANAKKEKIAKDNPNFAA